MELHGMRFSGFMVQLWPRDRVKSAAPTPLLPLSSPIKGSIPFCTPSQRSSNLLVNLYSSPPLRCSRRRHITPIGAADAVCRRRGRPEADTVLPSTFLRAVLCSSPSFESSEANCVVEDSNLIEDNPQDMLEQEGDAGDFDGDFDDEF
ncbi:uncharacterized protein LOC100278012 isoform 1 [Zea mays]|uniref:Uncharacterized protein n=1 Tax=Zea mays TaxID=4577 RepID=B6U325_MAIZE|nr:uncharacterized protein LOC100278012 isoform 1 [Zea mays]ACG43758.1 hypothetical protein [Zea mays]|eukprot:NP_001144903.1 uncharacterized protein LOC100278012 [Zea mays]